MNDDAGFIWLQRGFLDHPFFSPEPLSEREAFIWMVGEAAWKDHKRRLPAVVVELRRGQLAHSTRFMAHAWQWSESRVRRYLKRLKNAAMIDAVSDAHATLITVCNYDKYQSKRAVSDAPNDAPSDAQATHSRRTCDANKNQDNQYSDTNVSGAGAPIDARKALFNDGLASLKRQTGKTDDTARKLIGKWLKAAGDDAAKVLIKIRQAEADQAGDPVAWITAAISEQSEYKRLFGRN